MFKDNCPIMQAISINQTFKQFKINIDEIGSDQGLLNLAKKGILADFLWLLIKATKTTKADFQSILPVSIKTLERKKVLDTELSERVLNIARVYAKGTEVFGDMDTFNIWLLLHNPLMGDTPKNLLDTTTGCRIVEHELIRAQHGIMA